MKRTKRIIALLLAVVLCLPFTGCRALDTMRQEQAFRQEDGSILWSGAVYRPLSNYGDLNFPWEADIPTVCVTKPDVPVLLSNILGDSMEVYHDGLFLKGETFHYDVDSGVYCRADRYEEMVSRIAAGYETEIISYDYEKYDEEEWFVNATYTLTEEQAAAALEVYETVIPTTPQDGMEFISDYCISLYGGSKDGLFSRYLFDIELAGSTYYVTEWLGDDGGYLLYRVPEEKVPVFAALMNPMIEAQDELYNEEVFHENWTIGEGDTIML
ncbi:MAG: hypothetical protein IJO76_07345 [Clostridia bacterium]|nr:hypothetical protein [Clostridia bacterium]